MSPLLIPAPNRAAYLYVNVTGLLIFVAAFSLLLMGNLDRLRVPILVMLSSGFVYAIAIVGAYRSVVRRAIGSTELNERLRAFFSPFAQRVEFLRSDASDARAIFWKKNYCIIPTRLVGEILSKEGSERRKQTVLATVAHELGHLISRDTQQVMLCRVMFVYGVTSAICMWWALLLGRLEFHPYAVLGFTYVAGMFFT
jgi:hypothetical protein